MTDEATLVDERELIDELIRGMPGDHARLRAVCEALFGSREVAERQFMPRTAAILRSVYMERPRFPAGQVVGRLREFRDDLTEISAMIYGGPPRMLELPTASG